MIRLTQRTTRFVMVSLFAVALAWILTGWVFARFVHYHSQNRLLTPTDYEAEVVSADDYRLLADPTTKTVELADGRRITKGEGWDSVVPMYKPLDGATRYVRVTVKGTAPSLPVLESTLVPVAVVLVMGLAFTVAPRPHVVSRHDATWSKGATL